MTVDVVGVGGGIVVGGCGEGVDERDAVLVGLGAVGGIATAAAAVAVGGSIACEGFIRIVSLIAHRRRMEHRQHMGASFNTQAYPGPDYGTQPHQQSFHYPPSHIDINAPHQYSTRLRPSTSPAYTATQQQ